MFRVCTIDPIETIDLIHPIDRMDRIDRIDPIDRYHQNIKTLKFMIGYKLDIFSRAASISSISLYWNTTVYKQKWSPPKRGRPTTNPALSQATLEGREAASGSILLCLGSSWASSLVAVTTICQFL